MHRSDCTKKVAPTGVDTESGADDSASAVGYPAYVSRFRNALLAKTVDTIDLELSRPHVAGHRGILTTSLIQYNQEPFNLLGREHEFTFYLGPNNRVEISLQLYLNTSNHWRLYAYCRTGMLLSVNLTLLNRKSSVLSLSNKIHLATRGLTSEQRRERASALCGSLSRLGLEINEEGRLILGTFDVRTGNFVDTTAKAFLRDFTLASLLKGHFMGNKGYELPRLPRVRERLIVVRQTGSSRREISLGLRYQVLERAGSRCVNCGRSNAWAGASTSITLSLGQWVARPSSPTSSHSATNAISGKAIGRRNGSDPQEQLGDLQSTEPHRAESDSMSFRGSVVYP